MRHSKPSPRRKSRQSTPISTRSSTSERAPLPEPIPGLVISYAYLWQAEAARGIEEGVKDRPCAIILATRVSEGQRQVVVCPITHSAPNESGGGIEIPQTTKRRLGLDNERSWAVTREVNVFNWPGPDLRPIDIGGVQSFSYGILPPKLFRKLRDQVIGNFKARRARTVRRTK